MKINNIPLPVELITDDLRYPSWESYKDNDGNRIVTQFDLWYTERFGWCIPTLLIKKASSSHRERGISVDRMYAITLNRDTVRIGCGPHVLAKTTVYVKNSRKVVLEKFLTLKNEGEIFANEARDIRSSRSLRTSLHRSSHDWLSNGWGS